MRRTFLAVAAAATMILPAACGGGSSTGGGDEPDEVTVGVIPIVDVAPIYLGIEQGFFEQRDIKVNLESGQGGAAIVPGVVSEQFQFGFSNVTSLLLASSKGAATTDRRGGQLLDRRAGARLQRRRGAERQPDHRRRWSVRQDRLGEHLAEHR